MLFVTELIRNPKGVVFVEFLVERHKVEQAVVKVYSYQHTLYIFIGMALVIDDYFGVSEAVCGELVVGHDCSLIVLKSSSIAAS